MKSIRNLIIIIFGLLLLLIITIVFNIRIFNRGHASNSATPNAIVPKDLAPAVVEKKWKSISKNRKPLTVSESAERSKLAAQSSPLPYRSIDVDISYSASLDTFFVYKKTSLAERKLRSVLSPQMYQVYQKNNEYKLFVVGTHNVDYTKYVYEMAKNTIGVRGVYAQAPGAPPGQAPGDESPTEEDVTGAMNIFKAITTFNLGGGVKEGVTEDGAGGGSGGGGGAADINLGNADPQFDVNGDLVQTCYANKKAYVDAEKATGVPWYILAGIHAREGGCDSNKSLRSGRVLGVTEPDISEGCQNNVPGQGKPVPDGKDGCMFVTLLDSAIDTGNLLKSKATYLENGKDLTDLPTLIGALSYYNGGGNRNCGANRESVPYSGCPALYVGEDDPYVMNLYDKKHALMYIIYCLDSVACDPDLDGRPGVLAVAAAVKRKG